VNPRTAERDRVIEQRCGPADKLHQVPWSKLQFGNTKENSDNRVILPGMSQDAFNSLPEFHYSEGRG
jgi:hypothetical protein